MPLILTGVLGVLGRTSPNDVAAQRVTEPRRIGKRGGTHEPTEAHASMKILFINKGVAAKENDNCANCPPDDESVRAGEPGGSFKNAQSIDRV